MKKLIAYIVTLGLAMPSFANHSIKSKKQKPHVERGTFSSLVLTADEFKNLSSDDRTIYILSMIALTQILETSQNMVMDKVDQGHTAQMTNPWYRLWYQTLIHKAEAIWGLLLSVGGRVLPFASRMFAGTARYATVAAEGIGAKGAQMAEKAVLAKEAATAAKAAKAAVKAEKAAVKTAAAEAKSATKAAATETASLLANAKKEAEVSAKLLKEAEAALKKTKPGSAEYKQAETSLKDAFVKHQVDVREFLKKGGTMDEAYKMWGSAGGMSARLRSLRNFALGVGVTVAADKAIDMYLMEAPTPEQAAKEAGAPQSAGISPKIGGDVAGAESKKEAAETDIGHSCLFGLHRSVWTNQNGRVLCTRPAASRTPTCDGEDFQCPTMGLSDDNGSIAKNLCIKKNPLKDLTANCSEALKKILTTQKTEFKEVADYEKFRQDLLAYLASKEGMKDDDGKERSIAEYCTTESLIQREECKAINTVAKTINETGAGEQIAKREVAQAEVPAAAATPSAPAAPTAPAKGTK